MFMREGNYYSVIIVYVPYFCYLCDRLCVVKWKFGI